MSWRKRIPNLLSVSRGLISLAIGGLSITQQPLWIGSLFVVIGIITDKLDGSLARWWGVESETGKKLESVVDPLFLSMMVIYAVRFHGLPIWFIVVSGVFFLSMTAIRSWVSWKTKQLFYKKSPITRYGVGGGYLLLLWYVFHWPGKEIVLYVMTAVGVVMWFNYGRLLLATATNQAAMERTPKPDAPNGA